MTRKPYRDRTVTFLGLLIAYVVAANALGPLGASRAELFPFFNWSLFTNATAEIRTGVAIYIEGLNGRPLPHPTLVYRLKDRFEGIGDGISLAKATWMFAFAITEGDPEEIASVKNTIERTYLRGPKQVSYSVRLIEYRPLERYRTGKVTPAQIFGTFEKRE